MLKFAGKDVSKIQGPSQTHQVTVWQVKGSGKEILMEYLSGILEISEV
jgi:hypothetical protein